MGLGWMLKCVGIVRTGFFVEAEAEAEAEAFGVPENRRVAT